MLWLVSHLTVFDFVFFCLVPHVPCESRPCQNDGLCVNDANSVTQNNFTCYCTYKQTGAVCNESQYDIMMIFAVIDLL